VRLHFSLLSRRCWVFLICEWFLLQVTKKASVREVRWIRRMAVVHRTAIRRKLLAVHGIAVRKEPTAFFPKSRSHSRNPFPLPLWTHAYNLLFLSFPSGTDCFVDRNSLAGITIRYGSGIESRWGRDFLHPSAASGAWHWPLPLEASAEVEKRIVPYLSFPFAPTWPVVGWTVPFYFTFLQNPSGSPCL